MVREALAQLEEKGLVERKHGRGTFVKDPMASLHIGILSRLDVSAPACSGWWLPAVRHARRFFDELGYRVKLYIGQVPPGIDSGVQGGSPEFDDDVERGRLLGVLVVAGSDRGDWVRKLDARAIPIVGDGEGRYRVQVRYEDMVDAGIRKLVELGCRRIGVLRWGVGVDAIRDTYGRLGLDFRDAFVMSCRHPSTQGAGHREFLDLCRAMEGRMDGLMICDELHFGRASFAIMESGFRVPDQLKIVTHASEEGHVFSPLACHRIVYSAKRFAEVSAGILLRLIRGEHVPEGVRTLDFEWSTAPVGRVSVLPSAVATGATVGVGS